jgi:phosphocarrier protein
MKKIKITLETTGGLHARPASMLVNLVKTYDSDVMIKKDETDSLYNAKSMMSILSMGAGNGTSLEFQITGSDEEALEAKLKELLDKEFSA